VALLSKAWQMYSYFDYSASYPLFFSKKTKIRLVAGIFKRHLKALDRLLLYRVLAVISYSIYLLDYQ
jgi:hypothetical protein